MKKGLWIAGSIAALAISMPANAQDAASDSEIVVTAQKRTQVLSEIPQSISVVGGDKLQQQQATSFVDYAALVPGLSLQQANPARRASFCAASTPAAPA